jgi:hypothetical protein
LNAGLLWRNDRPVLKTLRRNCRNLPHGTKIMRQQNVGEHSGSN